MLGPNLVGVCCRCPSSSARLVVSRLVCFVWFSLLVPCRLSCPIVLSCPVSFRFSFVLPRVVSLFVLGPVSCCRVRLFWACRLVC